MGHKVRPTSLRLGITRNWSSRWYASKKDFGDQLVQDQQIRSFVKHEFYSAGVPEIEIERSDVAEKVGRDLDLLELQFEDDAVALRLRYSRHRQLVQQILASKLQDLTLEPAAANAGGPMKLKHW